ncbi:hypothetical protein EW146_g4095 [Bondarzewia mesenterica]|uniref:Uncharacterized protein n=1 Tax=Bondarzewia mesenterica TaxID=1095465 RepID=A0A4S4LW21_9AGAM|nr:hypothetical protein EW146_g4095 [Bondarzewia mesenterica]
MSSSHPLPSPLMTATTNAETNNQHRQRRFFIGPMPERVVSQTESQMRKPAQRTRRFFGLYDRIASSSENDDDSVADVIDDYAFQFFIGQGGKEEDWGEEQESHARREMLRRWKDSEWGRIWRRRKKDAGASRSRWVGGSFEVGDFVGINIINAEPPKCAKSPLSSKFGASTSRITLGVPSSAATRDTFETAPSHLTPLSEVPEDPFDATEPLSSEGPSTGEDDLHRASSSTVLLRPSAPPIQDRLPRKAHTDTFQRRFPHDDLPAQSRSDGDVNGTLVSSLRHIPAKSEGKKKAVHYPDSPNTIPAPPKEVLARSGDDLPESSAAAVEVRAVEEQSGGSPSLREPSSSRDIVMQDRMIVRVSHTRAQSVGASFDETQNRSAQHVHFENWAEFMVVWRGENIELYEDYTFPGKEWLIGHKHLAFIVPLNTLRTKLSLYSFVDLTFCLTCPPTPVHTVSRSRLPFHRAQEGLNIFVFKPRSRTRAVDWVWHLWRHLGGELPPFLEIHAPTADMRIKIITDSEDDGLTVFGRDNLIELCVKTLNTMQDWEMVMRRRLEQGAQLQLAWRMDTKLDWVRWQDDVDGKRREWAVIAGFALRQAGKAAHLEIRMGEHLPSRLHLKDGTQLEEPPGIEGYVDRIKPTTQARQSLYLTTHDGLLFSLPPPRAYPPRLPGSLPQPPSSGEDSYASMRDEEVRRGAQQVFEARGVTDLRNILMVRRAFQVVPHVQENIDGRPRRQGGHSEDEYEQELTAQVELGEGEEEDVGGQEGLGKLGPDRARGRMRRCFELVMRTGRVVRFEVVASFHTPLLLIHDYVCLQTYSCKIAIEWIQRLRALVRYWKRRHDTDARQEMDVVQLATGRPRITPRHRWHEDALTPPEPMKDLGAVLPNLSQLYNWCVLDGCRPITKTGRVFVRKGLRGSYKHVQLFIVSGHLIQYHMKADSVHHRRQGRAINLLDAYTASGVFAAQSLPSGQYRANGPPMARRYQDGLENDDAEEDTLFVLYYYPHSVGAGVDGIEVQAKGKDEAPIPKLSAERKLMVFRTRSRVERDVWCWALNTEIEKLVRAKAEREEKMRHAGGLVSV